MFLSLWVPPDFINSTVSNLWTSCRMKQRRLERERVREKDRKGERTSPIFIAWLQNENLTLSDGGLRKVRPGTDRWAGMKCVPSHVWSVYFFECVHVYLYPCDTCMVMDSLFLVLSVPLCFVSPSLPLTLFLSLSHTHTLTSYNTTEWGKRVRRLPLTWRLWYLRWLSGRQGGLWVFLEEPSREEPPHWSSPKTSTLTWYLSGVKSHGGMLGFVWRPHLVTDVQKARAESRVG